MRRPRRAAVGGVVYRVLNRANARMTIFENEADDAAFEEVLEEAVGRTRTRLLAYCVLPSHWHLVVWPRKDGELSRFTGWLTHTHRWHAHRPEQTEAELAAVRRLGLETTLRPPGRPQKPNNGS